MSPSVCVSSILLLVQKHFSLFHVASVAEATLYT